MKRVKLSDFKPNCRSLAESMWGSGGTSALRTNRRGAYYYSCSGHGGYLVLEDVLTPDELKNINEYIRPSTIQLLVQHDDNGEAIVVDKNANDFIHYGHRKRSFTYYNYYDKPIWVDYNVYVFEEDCDWSILEKFTDIRTIEILKRISNGDLTENEYNRIIDDSFNRWHLYKQ